MIRKWIVCILLFLCIQPALTYANQSKDQLSFIVKSSGESLFQSVLTVNSEPLIQALYNAKRATKVTTLPVATNYMLLEAEGKIQIFMMDDNEQFYHVQEKEKMVLPAAVSKKLIGYFNILHANHFGSLKSWDEVDTIMPRYTKFEVTDLETGLSFKVQRRAGKNHADVQPLTKADTKIMKAIYDNKWSWKRRAILVHLGKQTIAASMHGMPHGGGALANGFPGHFCIHFKDSVTHTTRSIDFSHQIMVYKAAGYLNEYVKQLPPEKIVELFFISLNQGDLELLNLIYSDETDQSASLINRVEYVRIINKEAKPTITGTFIYEIPIRYLLKEQKHPEIEQSVTFRVTRYSPTSSWKLEAIPNTNK